MSQVLINRKLGKSLYFCEGGMTKFLQDTGIKLGRKGVTPEEFAAQWQLVTPQWRRHAFIEYHPYLEMVAEEFDTTPEEWLGEDEVSDPFEGVVLGRSAGKPEFVSGKTAYIQQYEGGELCMSYSTPVGAKIGGNHYRTVNRYSVTTSHHMNKYGLRNDTPVTEAQLRGLARTGR